MNRIIDVTINDKTYPMAFTLSAYEYVARTYGGLKEFGEALDGTESVTAVLDSTVVLISQGIEKYKYERGDLNETAYTLEPVSRQELELTLDLPAVWVLKSKILEAITGGRKATVKGKPAKGAKKNEGSAETR